jgi:hypothetical protein
MRQSPVNTIMLDGGYKLSKIGMQCWAGWIFAVPHPVQVGRKLNAGVAAAAAA